MPGDFGDTGIDHAESAAWTRGMFHEIADCYLLAYVCRVPD